MLGYQPACACKYTVVAAPGEQGAALVGTTVDEVDESFATIVEEENLIIATESDQLMVFKVRADEPRVPPLPQLETLFDGKLKY